MHYQKIAFLLLPALFISTTAWPVQSGVAGNYRCWSYNVSGGGGSCRLAAPITLHADGTYRMSSEHGTYKVIGDRIELSESKIRGPGRLQHGNQIVFEYDYRGWHHVVTYLCQDCATTDGPPRTPAISNAPVAPKIVRVDLVLRFPRADGVLDWYNTAALIPQSGAQLYERSGRLPANGAEGLAYRAGERELATVIKSARTGQRYLVYVSSGRERRAVAELDLIDTRGPVDTTLDASFGNIAAPATVSNPAQPTSSERMSSPSERRRATATNPDAPPCNPYIPRYAQKGCRE